MEYNTENINRVTYEIIESYPTLLRDKIPLIQILLAVIYYSSFVFVIPYLLITRKLLPSIKSEETIGAENNALVSYVDLKSLSELKFERGEVISTHSTYLSKKDSKELASALEKMGYSILDNVGKDFIIKKRVEEVFELSEPQEYVIISVPKLAIMLNNFLVSIKLRG